ncbi:uncharacterized protein LOC126743449 [Anthonomus grandis grandis]|uniref:uncharacterized protein LOC126743449 n=1 Tax=Anthonomus grandis grandis TaxID=2921223 RepID=UPI0021653199|nr:uncharacterized protein LOC126743449 [Anthonomus grandis grandis]
MSAKDLHYCRLCMESSNLISMFSGKSRNCRDDFRKMIQESLGICIEQDNTTTTVCLNCLLDITYFHLFKLHCLQTERKLKSLELSSAPKPKKFKCQITPLNTVPSPDITKTEEAFNWLKAKRSAVEPSEHSQSFFEKGTQTDCERNNNIKFSSSGCQTVSDSKDVYCQTLQRALGVKLFSEHYFVPASKNGSLGEKDFLKLPFKKRNERMLLNGQTKKKKISCNTSENAFQNSSETVPKWFGKVGDGITQDSGSSQDKDHCLVLSQRRKSIEIQRKKQINNNVDKDQLFSPDIPQTCTSKRKNGLLNNPNCVTAKTIPLELSVTSEEHIKEERVSPSSSSLSPITDCTELLQVNLTKADIVEFCYWCGKTLYNNREIKRHEKLHMQCHLCKKKFKSVELTMNHSTLCKMKALGKEQLAHLYVDLVRIEEVEGVKEKYANAFQGLA